MPIMRDGEEWINLNTTVARIDSDLRNLSQKQERQHKENVERMDRIDASQERLSKDVAEINRIITRMEGVFDGVVSVGKLLAWLLAFVILLQTINTLFGPTLRRSLGLPNATNSQPGAQGELHNTQPQDAGLPASEYHASK